MSISRKMINLVYFRGRWNLSSFIRPSCWGRVVTRVHGIFLLHLWFIKALGLLMSPMQREVNAWPWGSILSKQFSFKEQIDGLSTLQGQRMAGICRGKMRAPPAGSICLLAPGLWPQTLLGRRHSLQPAGSSYLGLDIFEEPRMWIQEHEEHLGKNKPVPRETWLIRLPGEWLVALVQQGLRRRLYFWFRLFIFSGEVSTMFYSELQPK